MELISIREWKKLRKTTTIELDPVDEKKEPETKKKEPEEKKKDNFEVFVFAVVISIVMYFIGKVLEYSK